MATDLWDMYVFLFVQLEQTPNVYGYPDLWDMHVFFFVQLISEYSHIRDLGVI